MHCIFDEQRLCIFQRNDNDRELLPHLLQNLFGRSSNSSMFQSWLYLIHSLSYLLLQSSKLYQFRFLDAYKIFHQYFHPQIFCIQNWFLFFPVADNIKAESRGFMLLILFCTWMFRIRLQLSIGFVRDSKSA